MGPGSTLLRPGSSYKLSWRPQVPVKLRQGQVPVQILHPLDPLRKDSELWVPATPPNSFASPALQADTEVVAAALASPFYAEPLPPVPPSCVLRFAAEELTITTYTYAAAPVAAGHHVGVRDRDRERQNTY